METEILILIFGGGVCLFDSTFILEHVVFFFLVLCNVLRGMDLIL